MDQKQILAVVGIVMLVVVGGLLIIQISSQKPKEDNSSLNLDLNSKFSSPKNMPAVTELRIEDVAEGSGSAQVEKDDTITVHYKGALQDGSEFDSSYKRGEPFQFVIGSGSVIEGWEKGLLGMKLGGKRRLTIPPSMGYGESGQGPIPPNSVLIFEVELLDLQKKELTPTPEVTPTSQP